MSTKASIVRRTVRRLVQAAVFAGAVIALASTAGCERPPEPAEDREISTADVTEDQFVEHMAALTVAIEDGLTGEEARDRAVELSGSRHTREEMEAFAGLLREDPVKWAAVANRIDRRVDEIRSAGTQGPEEGGGANRSPGGRATFPRRATSRP